MERTDTQILFNTLDLTFNGEKVQIKKRSIRKTEEWLNSVLAKDGKPFKEFAENQSRDVPMPVGYRNIIELISEYSDGLLTPDQISEGYPEELAAAFDTLLEVSGFFDLMWGKTPRLTGLIRAQRQ